MLFNTEARFYCPVIGPGAKLSPLLRVIGPNGSKQLLELRKVTATKKVHGKTRKARSAKAGKATNGKSLHGEILAKLRDYVVEGGLLNGERIPERQLCESVGIARTPLREALQVLAAEGLIDLLPNRGARVRVLSRVELRELYEVMGSMEALAGRLACENITDDELAEIEKLHHEMYAFYLRRDLHAYFDCKQKIHEKILLVARNDRLAKTCAALANQLRRSRYSANLENTRDRWADAMREHEAILDALNRRAGSELSEIFFSLLRNKGIAAIAKLDEIIMQDAGADARRS